MNFDCIIIAPFSDCRPARADRQSEAPPANKRISAYHRQGRQRVLCLADPGTPPQRCIAVRAISQSLEIGKSCLLAVQKHACLIIGIACCHHHRQGQQSRRPVAFMNYNARLRGSSPAAQQAPFDFGRMVERRARHGAVSAASGSSFSSASRASPICPRNAVSLSRVSKSLKPG